ncbi:hypothetical protein ACQKTA_01645 [Enterococcus sp. 22-H-5-01]|uniref:hypothetical protein n=1 Tax=Enterococcus sp. 22-H-5-01 TaxID=3418555 RepID=UPI003D07BC04
MLNKKVIRLLPFFFFFIPYVHLTLAMDYLFHSIIGILLFTTASVVIGFYGKVSYQIPLFDFWERIEHFNKYFTGFNRKSNYYILSFILPAISLRSIVIAFFDCTIYWYFLGQSLFKEKYCYF